MAPIGYCPPLHGPCCADAWSWYSITKKDGLRAKAVHLYFKIGSDGLSVVQAEAYTSAVPACGIHTTRREYIGDPPPHWYHPCGRCLAIWRRWVYEGVVHGDL